MKIKQDDLWLCSDCMLAAVNDDYSGLDYHYGPEESKTRMQEIRAGLENLGPHLVPDFQDGNGEEDFSRRSCDCCNTGLAGARYRFAVLEEEAYPAAFFAQYLEAMLWSSLGEDGEPLDKTHSRSDLSNELIWKSQEDCHAFWLQSREILETLDPGHAGHDFWLTRNRHGAGFWDGDYPEDIGKILTDRAHAFGGQDPYTGDDGRIYL